MSLAQRRGRRGGAEERRPASSLHVCPLLGTGRSETVLSPMKQGKMTAYGTLDADVVRLLHTHVYIRTCAW